MFKGQLALDKGLRLFVRARAHVARAINLIAEHKADNDAKLRAEHVEADKMLDDAKRLEAASQEHRAVASADHQERHAELDAAHARALRSLNLLDQLAGEA